MRLMNAIAMLIVSISTCTSGYPRLLKFYEWRKSWDSVHLTRDRQRFKLWPFLHDKETSQVGAIPFIRGGQLNASETIGRDEAAQVKNGASESRSSQCRKRQARHTSDVVRNILERKAIMGLDEISLREKIDQRATEYLAEIQSSEKPVSPLKVLHYLAPKVPAIKQSPDFMVRIHTARGDLDSGIAATIISTMARLCIQYEKRTGLSAVGEICKDRRFEQLVECVLCGVDVSKRTQESMAFGEVHSTMQIDMETLLDEENVKIHEGLSVPDTCRAAWGIAMLVGYGQSSFGGQKTTDILTALSLRTRERLLARLQLLRQGELRSYTSSEMSLNEGFEKDTKDLAEDVASAIWTFACVKAVTGLRTVPLFEASCSLLCQNPLQLREREQAKKSGLDRNDFDVEELVEKLAKSENSTKDQDLHIDINDHDEVEDKDILLHWLSPNEVAGIMWAVALHGRAHDTGAKEEMKLSETATALSEIAFDCISDWLKEDLSMLRESKTRTRNLNYEQGERIHIGEQELVEQIDGVVVEVVDAATILAKESVQASLEEIDVAVGESTLAKEAFLANGESVQVINSPTLVANNDAEESPEVLISSSPLTEENATLTEENATWLESQSFFLPSQRTDPDPHFTNHKLCSIAWAASDLQDSLCNLLVDTVCEILVEQGSQCMSDLGGGDIANLAWAIARRTQSHDFAPSHDADTRIQSLLRWIANRSLELLELHKGNLVFQEFQAPELGRLIWSLSIIHMKLAKRMEESTVADKCVRQLALHTLSLSHSFTSRFGSEDLARIVWGFLELSVLEDVFRDPAVAASLGHITSLMESSVLRWESGQCEKSAKLASPQVDESIRLKSFFGKPRLALRLLEQRLETAHDDEDESQISDAAKTLKLPLLRDLSLDPSTMCKLAFSLSRLNHWLRELDGAWTFTRVAVRLMCSKHGQLLRVSSIEDNVRLAYACVKNQVNGHGRDFVSRLYARRLVQFLNEQLENLEGCSVSDQLAISSEEMATLVWALGYLNVRHWTSEHGADGIAYNKPRLVTSLPFLSESQLSSSPSSVLARLLYGSVSMEMLSTAPEHILSLLIALESKAQEDFTVVDLCELTECLARIITIARGADENLFSNKNHTNTLVEQRNSTGIDVDEVMSPSSNAGSSPTAAIAASTLRLLNATALAAIGKLSSMTAVEIRKLLASFALLPFQADELVDAIDCEVNQRLNATKYGTNLPEAALRAASAARSSWEALTDKSGEGSSRLASLRKGLRSLFVPSPGEEEGGEDDEGSDKLETVADLLTETASTANLVTDYFSRVSKLTNKDPGLLLSAEQRASIFELSRCEELIANYRLVDFGTGRRQSRQDNDQLQGIGHQVISRIFY